MSKTYKRMAEQTYVAGNNAVKIDGNYTAYRQKRDLEKGNRTLNTKQHNKQQSKQKTEVNKKATHVKTNRAYTIALTFAIIATLAIIMMLLKSQFAVTEASEHVIELQKELVQIKKSNELLTSEINHSINMEEVYEIATTQLGMIQPTSDDVTYISTPKSSYTVVLEDINVPMQETEVTIGNVLGFIK